MGKETKEQIQVKEWMSPLDDLTFYDASSKATIHGNNINRFNRGMKDTHPDIGEQRNKENYDKMILEASNIPNVYQQFADQKYIGQNHGQILKIRKRNHIRMRDAVTVGAIPLSDIKQVTTDFALAALPEGTISKRSLEIKDEWVSTTLSRYGHEMDYTDELRDFTDPEISIEDRYAFELSKYLGEIYEDMVQHSMMETTNVINAGTATQVSELGKEIDQFGKLDKQWTISYKILKRAVERLKFNRAKKTTRILTGSTKSNTMPIAAAYYAIVHPRVASDLQELTKKVGNQEKEVFIPVERYAAAGNIAKDEIGAAGEVRFVESSTQFVDTAAGAVVPEGYAGELSFSPDPDNEGQYRFDVFPTLFPSDGSFATVGVRGNNKVLILKSPPEKIDGTNRFGTTGFVTGQFWYGSIILEEGKLLKLNTLATA